MGRVFFAIAFLAGIVAFPPPSLAIDKCGSGPRVTCVVDGDTFWLNGEKIRSMGFDTPEPQTNLCGGEAEKRLADQASQRFMELLNTTEVTLERRGSDRYGRTLAIVRVNGTPVGDLLIAERLARRYPDGAEFWCN